MSFNGTEGGPIDLNDGATLTGNYRAAGNTELGAFYGKDILRQILDQEGCMGIRIYYGVNKKTGKKEMVLVGADANEDDMLELVADTGSRTPPYSGASNSLNS